MLNKQNKKQKRRISPNVIAIIGALIIVTGGFFLSYNYVQSKKVMAYDYMTNVFYTQNNKDEQEEIIIEENKEEKITEQTENQVITNEYIGYLNIPKINLTKGFLDKNAPDNDVEKNILVVEGSNYPDVKKGNLILAGHSGSGWKAFFNDLYKLEIGDSAYIDYKNKKYNYKIVNIYKQQKVGTIAIYRNYDKTTLTLVTCTNNDRTTQTVYIAELESIE